MTDLDSAIARLKDFRATWEDDAVIDEESRLSAADLDAIIRVAEDLVPIAMVDLGAPGVVEGVAAGRSLSRQSGYQPEPFTKPQRVSAVGRLMSPAPHLGSSAVSGYLHAAAAQPLYHAHPVRGMPVYAADTLKLSNRCDAGATSPV